MRVVLWECRLSDGVGAKRRVCGVRGVLYNPRSSFIAMSNKRPLMLPALDVWERVLWSTGHTCRYWTTHQLKLRKKCKRFHRVLRENLNFRENLYGDPDTYSMIRMPVCMPQKRLQLLFLQASRCMILTFGSADGGTTNPISTPFVNCASRILQAFVSSK